MLPVSILFLSRWFIMTDSLLLILFSMPSWHELCQASQSAPHTPSLIRPHLLFISQVHVKCTSSCCWSNGLFTRNCRLLVYVFVHPVYFRVLCAKCEHVTPRVWMCACTVHKCINLKGIENKKTKGDCSCVSILGTKFHFNAIFNFR